MLADWIYIWPCQNWVYMYSICHISRHDINLGKRWYGATFHELGGGKNLIPLFIWFTPIMSVKFGGAVGWFNLIAIIPEQMNRPNSTRITGWKRGWNSLKKLIWGKSEKRSVHVACTPGKQLAKAACPTAKLRAPGTRARSIFRPVNGWWLGGDRGVTGSYFLWGWDPEHCVGK